MGGLNSAEEERDYVLLRDVKVEFGNIDGGDGDNADEANGFFTLCFWLYIDKCDFPPSVILVQKHPAVTSGVPFLWLDDKKRMKLFPLLFIHEEAMSPDNYVPWTEFACASTEFEFPVKKWVHVGCEVLRDLLRLHVDGRIVGEQPLTCSIDEEFHAEALKKIHLEYPEENEDTFRSYVHGLDLLSATAVVKTHYVKDPPVRLSIDCLRSSEIEEDSDGVWSIVGGKSSCRRSFSLDVILLDAFDRVVHKKLEVVASLLYADNEAPVENTTDEEPPILAGYDGIEFDSHDRPSKVINGCASFRLKISQLSSKCENRLFRIKFTIPKFGRFPFLETLSPSIRCVSRSKNVKTTSQTFKKSSYRMNNFDHPPGNLDESMEIIPNIVREANPRPSSKQVKLGNDALQVNKEHKSRAWTSYENNTDKMRIWPENHSKAANNNSRASDNNRETKISGPKSMMMRGILSPISDAIIFKYCLGSPTERCELLKEIAISVTEEQLANFADQVSLFSGCSHHRQQIVMSKRLVEDGIQAWTSISKNNSDLLWDNLVFMINERFMKIACSTRSLTEQDFDCLRRVFGCRDLVSQEDFERLWSWLYPVAFTLSQSAINAMWNSMSSPIWMQGFITKEEAESAIQDPGTFVLRFPTSRSWPHPDAGNLVVTYVGRDLKIHHRLLSLDFVISISSKESNVKPLQELLLQEPELSRLGQKIRSH